MVSKMMATHDPTSMAATVSRFLPTVTDKELKRVYGFTAPGEFSESTFTHTEVENRYRTPNVSRRPVSIQSKTVSRINMEMQNNMDQLQNTRDDFLKLQDPDQANKGVKLADQLKILADKVKQTQVKLNQLVNGGN